MQIQQQDSVPELPDAMLPCPDILKFWRCKGHISVMVFRANGVRTEGFDYQTCKLCGIAEVSRDEEYLVGGFAGQMQDCVWLELLDVAGEYSGLLQDDFVCAHAEFIFSNNESIVRVLCGRGAWISARSS